MAPVHVDCAVKCSGGRGGVEVEGRVCVWAGVGMGGGGGGGGGGGDSILLEG